jgi:hypothetical protein
MSARDLLTIGYTVMDDDYLFSTALLLADYMS